MDFLFHLVVTTPREKGVQCNHLGFDLFRIGRNDTLYIEVILLMKGLSYRLDMDFRRSKQLCMFICKARGHVL